MGAAGRQCLNQEVPMARSQLGEFEKVKHVGGRKNRGIVQDRIVGEKKGGLLWGGGIRGKCSG